MNLATAQQINTAACYLGLGVLGIVGNVDAQHVRIVASASLAQLQTAKDVVEAENERRMADTTVTKRTMQCTCEDGLLVKVKTLADELISTIP